MSIAVLVPAFNAEKYLTQCLDSIRAQTLPGVEIFCAMMARPIRRAIY